MKMSITRALVELKNLDKKITQATTGVNFVGITVGKDNNKKVHSPQGYDVKSCTEVIQGNFDKVTKLIKIDSKLSLLLCRVTRQLMLRLQVKQ